MAVLTALGSGIWISTLFGEPEGWSVLLIAPAAALAAGIVAGLIAASRRILMLGFLPALLGLAIGVTVGTLSWGALGEGGGSIWLTFVLTITGVPFAVGYGVIALAATRWGREFLLWIGLASLWDRLTGRRS